MNKNEQHYVIFLETLFDFWKQPDVTPCFAPKCQVGPKAPFKSMLGTYLAGFLWIKFGFQVLNHRSAITCHPHLPSEGFRVPPLVDLAASETVLQHLHLLTATGLMAGASATILWRGATRNMPSWLKLQVA